MTAVKAGEKWRCNACDCVLTATGETRAPDWPEAAACEPVRCQLTAALTHMGIWPLVDHARIEAAPPAVIGWSRWLPPKELPRVMGREFKPGQVWAFNSGASAAVVLIGVDPTDCEHVCLATKHGSVDIGMQFSVGGNHRAHAVLVQDVDQPEPTPPELLYGAPPKVEAKPAETPTRATWTPPLGMSAWMPKIVDPYSYAPAAPANCGHPGPKGYGGLCFPCHAREDADLAERWRLDQLDAFVPVDPPFRPAAQSHVIGVGCAGVWGLKEKNR